MTRIKIIELKTELEAKHDLLEVLIREKQQVHHVRQGSHERELNGLVDVEMLI
jgi:hypothetical protein